MKHHSAKSGSGHHHRLDDADPDLLEQKRAELKKELELQLKMESAARKPKSSTMAGSKSGIDGARKRKQMARRSSSSSSSSSSGSDSSSDSSSSDSCRRTGKTRKNAKTKRHQSSSSSGDDDPRRKANAGSSSAAAAAAKAKRVCQKKLEASGKVKSHHVRKTTIDKPNLIVQRKRSPSPSQIVVRKHQRPASPSAALKSAASSKGASKSYADHHRMKEHHATSMGGAGTSSGLGQHRSDREREFQMRERDRDRERERAVDRDNHLRSRERMRSRSPPPSMQQAKQMRMRSRSPAGGFKRLSRPRDMKQRTPPPNVSSHRRASSKGRAIASGAPIGVVRRGDRTPERIIIKKDVSGGKRHESSREREQLRRDRDRGDRDAMALREKERLDVLRLQEQRKDRDRVDQERLRVKVIDPRDRDADQRVVGKTERLLPRPADRAIAIAAARDQGRDKSEERGMLMDMHHRPRSHSQSRSNRGDRGMDRGDAYSDRVYDRMDDRYESHRRADMDRSSAGGVRDDRSDRGDREYGSMRRREDSRGRIVEEGSPYLSSRDKVRGGPMSERDRSMERDREQRSVYGSERDRELRMHDGGRYEEHGGRGGGGSVDERRGRGGSERGIDYNRPSSRGAYIDESSRGAPRRPSIEPQQHRERSGAERDAWYRGGQDGGGERDDRGSHHHYDRHSSRDWEHNEQRAPNNRQPSVGRADGNYSMDDSRRDGNPNWANERQWSDGRGGDRGHHGSERGGAGSHVTRGHSGDRPNWHQTERETENWDGPEDYGAGDYHRGGHVPEKVAAHHDVEVMNHGMGVANRGGGLGNRRWPNWRGGRGGGRGGSGSGNNEHHVPQQSTNLFRRQNQMHNQPEGYQDHQAEHPLRRQQGGGHGEYQQPHHHGHNVFSTSIVRPLLSLPPLKPPIMDDGPLLPSMGPKKLLPTPFMNPMVSGPIVNEDVSPVVVPSKSIMVIEPHVLNSSIEHKHLSVKAELGGDGSAAPIKDVAKDDAGSEKDASGDVEEDALSEISDDADEILNRQEEEAAAAAALLAAAPLPLLPSTPMQKPALLPTPPFKVGEFPRLLVNQPFGPVTLLSMPPFDEPPHLHHMTHHHHHHHPPPILNKPPMMPVHLGGGGANVDHLHAIEPNADDLDLDFEEISDGELEEEARIRGLGDALGVDWASLVEESKNKTHIDQRSNVFASAKQRWQPHRILLDVGVSFRMAGKDFASNVLNAAHRRLTADEAAARQRVEAEAATLEKLKVDEQQQQQTEFTIKKEVPDEDGEEGATEQVVFSVKTIEEKEEAPAAEEDEVEPPQAELLIHPIACVQVASRVNAEIRKNLVFGMTGPFSRALSAHKDVQMRRQLCGLSVQSCGGPLRRTRAGGAAASVDYAAIARQLFEKALGKVN